MAKTTSGIFVLALLLLASRADAASLELKALTPTLSPSGYQGLFSQGDHRFTVDVCARLILVREAVGHEAVNELGLGGERVKSPSFLVEEDGGEPIFVLKTGGAIPPFLLGSPLNGTRLTTPRTEVEVTGGASAATFSEGWKGYVSFWHPENDETTRLSTFNLANQTERTQTLAGLPRSNSIQWIQNAGKSYAAMRLRRPSRKKLGYPSGLDWILVVDPLGSEAQRALDTRFLHPSGTVDIVSAQWSGQPVIATLGRAELRRGFFNVGIWNPFATGPRFVDGFSVPFRPKFPGSYRDKVTAREMPTTEFNRAQFFEEGKDNYVLFPHTWLERSGDDWRFFKQYFVYDHTRATITQLEFPWFEDPEIKGPAIPRKIENLDRDFNELILVKGPEGKHYGAMVMRDGQVFLIRLATGEIVARTQIPLDATIGAEFHMGESCDQTPNLFTKPKPEGTGEEIFLTGITRNPVNLKSARRYTIQIHL